MPRLESLAKNVYGATGIELAPSARTRLNQIEKWGLGELQLCVAKTHLATTHDPADGGLPRPFTLPVRDVLVRAGAGFATVLTGELTTLPALGTRPNAVDMDLDPVTGAALGL
ncbi:formate--tetrahydrofolate ligase [Nannocystis pusilla]|uniref:formate--tetrahydrofolate ligase n=1 Tax=Nannocystis pusilla TaxID=889268 RepID=UPI003B7DB777